VDFRCSPNNIDPIIRGYFAGYKNLAVPYCILADWDCIPAISLRLTGRSTTQYALHSRPHAGLFESLLFYHESTKRQASEG
jgi:hypothetical protein